LVNGTSVKQLLALPQHLGNYDHQVVSTEEQKDKSKVVPCQVCTVDAQNTPIQNAATMLLLVRHCGSLPTLVTFIFSAL
jgi:hypothetical protein